MYRTTKQFLRSFHLTSLEDLPEMPELGGEGQMRLDESGQIVDPSAKPRPPESVDESSPQGAD